ncbi:MAG: sulfatase-like hydrolase/transferase [Sporomusaceae bacterium]|nr:sulfatase-like hydrolase/transferase [Sporomusaceae bacterium]
MIWEKIYRELQQDLKLVFFLIAVISCFRIAFIVYMHHYLADMTTLSDVFAALYYGLRISLKSAGLMGLFCFSFCLICRGLKPRWVDKLRLIVGGSYLFLLTLLFYARIPYYEQFHMSFNQLLFNTFQDDVSALGHTLLEQYNLPLRLSLVAVTAFLLQRLLVRWLSVRIVFLPSFSRWYYTALLRAGFLVAFYFFCLFMRFGGTLTYAQNIDWENSGVTKDQLLNEAILDDVQALYRAYELNERVNSSTGLAIDSTKLQLYSQALAGRSLQSDKLDDYLQKTAQGAAHPKPKHVFLIIGESYANWPLLPEYKDLHIADGVKNLIQKQNSVYVPTFLPNGMSTISGVMGVLTGFPDVNLYLNCLPEAYGGPFSTAIAPQMKRLGYKAEFWYAGPSSWEKIKDFTLAQGFDRFYGSGDYPSASGNVWGSDDAYLFQGVSASLTAEQPTFDVILTVSNHAPFTVDLPAAGFDSEMVKAALPDDKKNDVNLIKQLGHFWYADKELAAFIKRTEEQYPDSVFMIVGDHADRLNIEANPGLYKRYGIPLIVYGKGITKQSLPVDAAGSHINVTPTLLELIAPQGFTYYSLGDSLTRGNRIGINYGFWITNKAIGKEASKEQEAVFGADPAGDLDQEQIEAAFERLRSVAWWRIKHGNTMKLPTAEQGISGQ